MHMQAIFYQINISIHALLAESDFAGCGHVAGRHQISIHALLAESDTETITITTATHTFLSTLSLRRATYTLYCPPFGEIISIHALLAESDGYNDNDYSGNNIISIHALLAESDPMTAPPRHKMSTFLSTLSLRRAT